MINPAPIDVLMANPPVVNISDITDGTTSGAGVFDSLMRSVGVHLNDQLTKGRINGTDFSSVYLEALKHTMSVSVELSLAKQKQAYELELLRKQSLLADEEIKSAKLSQENAKKQNKLIERQTILVDGQLDLIHYDLNTKFPAEVANTIKQGVILDKEAGIKQFQLDNLLPNELARGVQQLDVTERTTVLQENQSLAQINDIKAGIAIKEYQLNALLPNELERGVQQLDIVERTTVLQEQQSVAQIADIVKSTEIKNYQLESLLPNELARGIQQLDINERTTVIQELQSAATIVGINKQNEILTYDLATKLPVEVSNLTKQGTLLDKQVEVSERTTAIQEAQSVAQVADILKTTAIKDYQLNSMMPVELANATKQGVILDKQSLISDEEIKSAKLAQDNAKKQNRLIERQTILADGQMDLIHFDLNTKLPVEVANTIKQGDILVKQGVLLDKQAETAEAQIANMETQTTLYAQKTISEKAQTDESVIGTGSLVDEQRLLVREQRLGFERDNMHKVARLYADNWLARYTEQPGDTFAPDANLNDENAKQVMAKLLASLGLTPIAPAPAPPPTTP